MLESRHLEPDQIPHPLLPLNGAVSCAPAPRALR
jgi:hypothetical protein